MDIPDRVSGTASAVTSDEDGDILAAVWSSAMPGTYDVVLDVGGDGDYNEDVDALDDIDVSGGGFFVIPEYVGGTILALAVCFAVVGVYARSKRRPPKPS
jgi:hypothetical protein